MALIECPECGREVSSNALACPTCAYPVATGTPSEPVRAVAPRKMRNRAMLAVQIVPRLFVGAMLIGVGVDGSPEDAAIAATIGGILVAVSAIPVWIRARSGQLLSRAEREMIALVGKGSAGRLEERVATMEERHREQMAELARMQADQIAELEERVDFAERLLTKQREQINPQVPAGPQPGSPQSAAGETPV